jgi:hypothetical protein
MLPARAISTTATTVSPGAPYPVTGSNWYPGETVSIKGGVAGAVAGTITNTKAVVGTGASSGNTTVTITTAAAHGLTVSNYVSVSGSTNGGGGVNIGNIKVASPTATTFSYVDPNLSGPPGATLFDSADTGTVRINPGTQSATDTASTIVASSTGTISGNAITNDATSNDFYATGIQNGGAPGTAPAQNYAVSNLFSLAADQCVAVSNGNHSNNSVVNTGANAADNLATPGSCSTSQTLNVTVTGGVLKQAATVVSTPNPNGSANSNATTVNFGSVATPVSAVVLPASLNQVQVTDTRGGTFGWSLTATLPNLTAPGGLSISNANVTATPSCAADAGNPLSAPGATAGTAAQAYSGTVNLCTKNNAVNATTLSSGGVYNVNAALALTIPAFQAAGAYSSVMTITLS